METIIGNTREYLYENILPKNSVCAEIGVDAGINSERIINFSNPKKLYLIDMWDYSKYRNLPVVNEKGIPDWYRSQQLKDKTQKIYERVVEKFKNNLKVEIIRELSVDAAKKFKDNYFDWVYIDGSHDAVSVKEDMETWWPKVKGGGHLCGHDYDNNWVSLAVNEFLIKYSLELYYKGNQIGDQISDWCVIKIK